MYDSKSSGARIDRYVPLPKTGGVSFLLELEASSFPCPRIHLYLSVSLARPRQEAAAGLTTGTPSIIPVLPSPFLLCDRDAGQLKP